MQGGRPPQHDGQGESEFAPDGTARVGLFSRKENDMHVTSRHCAHNDKRRIRALEKNVDRLLVALARYSVHEIACRERGFSAILDRQDGALARVCSCGLTAIIATRGAE